MPLPKNPQKRALWKARQRKSHLGKKKHTPESIAKIVSKTRGLKRSKEFCQKTSERMKGNKIPEVTKLKISHTLRLKLDEEYIKKEYELNLRSSSDIANELGVSCTTIIERLRRNGVRIRTGGVTLRGFKHSEEAKRNMIDAQKKIPSKFGSEASNWQGGKSFEPYCPKFNFTMKEEIRNRDGRKCVLCNKPEILEGRRMSVHHIDGDKMQGCGEKKWHLISLCKSCNSSKDTLEKEFLIVSNNVR